MLQRKFVVFAARQRDRKPAAYMQADTEWRSVDAFTASGKVCNCKAGQLRNITLRFACGLLDGTSKRKKNKKNTKN
jgi:hypothetical protein